MALSIYMLISDGSIASGADAKSNLDARTLLEAARAVDPKSNLGAVLDPKLNQGPAFEVLSLGYGASLPNVGGRPGGAPVYTDVSVTMNAVSGPRLLGSLARSELHTVTFILTGALASKSSTGGVLEVIVLKGAFLTSFSESATAGSAAPGLSLTFGCAGFEYDLGDGSARFQR